MLKLSNWHFRNGEALIKVRIYVYILTLAHLTIMSIYLLNQDYSKSPDPILQAYVRLKWKLITAWFNLITGPYLVMSIYCEWRALQGKGETNNVLLVNKMRHFLFSSIILPVTVFADVLFWHIYNKDRTLLMPLSADEFISLWNHHSMHTVSLVFVLFDLIIVPRERPKSMTAQIIALGSFLTVYLIACVWSLLQGEYVYPIIKRFSGTKLIGTAGYVYIASFFYYISQWFVVDGIRSCTAMTSKNV